MKRIAIVVFVLAAVVMVAGCSGIIAKARPGTAIVLQVDPKDRSTLPTDPAKRTKVMEQARNVLVKRVAGLAIGEPRVVLQGSDKIVITVSSAKDAVKILPMLSSTGTLEFYHLQNVKTGNNPTAYWRMSPNDSAKGKSFRFAGLKGETIDSLTQPQDVLTKVVDPKNNPPVLTGADLKPNAIAEIDQQDGVVIRIDFDEKGTRVFRDFTRANNREILAILYNGKLLTAPEIREAIPGGKAQISGFKDITEAKQVADNLNAGKMPVRLVVANSKP